MSRCFGTLSSISSANVQAKDVKGTLHFKKLSDVNSNDGQYASYNDDRIVFYRSDTFGTTFVAYVCFSLAFFTV